MERMLDTPGRILVIDLDDARLAKAIEFGADVVVNNGREDTVKKVMELTGGLGVDVAMEAVGVPVTLELAAELVRPGGTVANIVAASRSCSPSSRAAAWIPPSWPPTTSRSKRRCRLRRICRCCQQQGAEGRARGHTGQGRAAAEGRGEHRRPNHPLMAGRGIALRLVLAQESAAG